MTNEEILNVCNSKSIEELRQLSKDIKHLSNEKFSRAFEVVIVYHSAGNISEKISIETGFQCIYTRPGRYSMRRGTNIIIIPKEVYTEELRKELISKYERI